MQTQTVIGVESPKPKLYKVGSYILRQKAAGDFTLEEQDPLLAVVRTLKMTELSAFAKHTLITFFDTLDREGQIQKALDMLLEFHDLSYVAMLWRKVKMWATRTTKADVIRRMKRDAAAGVIEDFFAVNFNSKEV